MSSLSPDDVQDVTKVGEPDTSSDRRDGKAPFPLDWPAQWVPTGDGGFCSGNRDGEATRFVCIEDRDVEISDGDQSARAPMNVVARAIAAHLAKEDL